MKSPLVSIVILNWNGKQLLKKCLHSVFRLNYPNYEVIVVDNASTDGSADFVGENYPKVRLVRNKKNLGCAGGNNSGMKIAKGKYICNLANDAKPYPNWLSELVKVAESDNRIGVCGSKQVFMHNPKIINSTGIVMSKDGVCRNRGWGELDKGQYEKIEELLSVPNVAVLYRKQMLKSIGLLDNDLFIYYEDTDLGWRARLRGWKIVYVPKAKVQHVVDATFRKYPYIKAYLMHRNRLLVMVKNFSFTSILMYLPHILITELVLVFYGLSKKSLADLKAIFGAVKMLPKFIKKRRDVQSKRTVEEKQIRQFIVNPPYIKFIKRLFKKRENETLYSL